MRKLWPDSHKYRTGHHNHIGHRQVGKYGCGHGGINCACCTVLPPNELKKKFARYLRRKNKQYLTSLTTTSVLEIE